MQQYDISYVKSAIIPPLQDPGARMPISDFRFRRHDTVGTAAAEEDSEFLTTCFVDTGDLAILRDCANPRSIVLGRTGTGKTALLAELAKRETHIITIRPESLALSYISNSDILQYLIRLGVHLDIFFKLLWRHVFTVEIIRNYFNIIDENANKSFWSKIYSLFADQTHAKAIEYLKRWGSSFWEQTDYRVKELTTTLEGEVSASLGFNIGALRTKAKAGHTITEEQKAEVVYRAQEVVNRVQIRELSDVMNMLDSVLSDPQKRYYIIIDKLDQDWVDDPLRCRLIRALIETIRDFRQVHYAKIVVALRVDLLERVIRLTRDANYQEEKYTALFLRLNWSPQRLTELLDKRIDHLIRPQYSSHGVTHKDILPPTVDGEDTIHYILSRTFLRPRDVITFLNNCIELAVDRHAITVEMLRHAEMPYSRGRIESIADEWYGRYPNLLAFIDILKQSPPTFSLSALTDTKCEDLCLKLAAAGFQKPDELSSEAQKVVDTLTSASDFRRLLILVFYRIGLVGLKADAHATTSWSTGGAPSPAISDIHDNLRVTIHPIAYRYLGTAPQSSR